MQEALQSGHAMRGREGAEVDAGDTAYTRGQTRSQMEHRDKPQQERRQLMRPPTFRCGDALRGEVVLQRSPAAPVVSDV